MRSSRLKSQIPTTGKLLHLHHVILVASGGGDFCADGTVDQLIRRVLALKKNPILVLGPEGDDVLLHSRLAESCDLAFDPNYQGRLFSGIHAGLHAANGAALIFPIARAMKDASLWNNDFLWQRFERVVLDTAASLPSDRVDILRPPTRHINSRNISLSEEHDLSSEERLEFPQLVTGSGARRLMELPAQTPWCSPTHMRSEELPCPSPQMLTP